MLHSLRIITVNFYQPSKRSVYILGVKPMATDISQMRGTAATQRQEPKDFPAMLKAFMPEIARALPKHMDADRMTRIALTAFRQNPALGNCDPKSVFAAVIMSSQLGLEIGIQGQAYLVPYGKQCQFIAGWQGLADLVSRSGRAAVWTGAVYEGDDFDYGMGSEQWIKHKAGDMHGIGKLTHLYAVGKIKGSEHSIIEVWTVKRVEAHRDRYNKVGKRHYSYENFEMYGRKIALLQVLKYMPKSVELNTIEQLDHAASAGQSQGFTLDDAIKGEYTYVAPEPEQQAEPQGQQPVIEQPQQQQAPKNNMVDDFNREMAEANAGGIDGLE
jgi:recombination protein RecT